MDEPHTDHTSLPAEVEPSEASDEFDDVDSELGSETGSCLRDEANFLLPDSRLLHPHRFNLINSLIGANKVDAFLDGLSDEEDADDLFGFGHGRLSLRRSRLDENSPLCCYHLQGRCKFGDRCDFSHKDDRMGPCQFGAGCWLGHGKLGAGIRHASLGPLSGGADAVRKEQPCTMQ